MLDMTRLVGCFSLIKDHNVMDLKCNYGFLVMSNAQEHYGFQVSTMNFKQ